MAKHQFWKIIVTYDDGSKGEDFADTYDEMLAKCREWKSFANVKNAVPKKRYPK